MLTPAVDLSASASSAHETPEQPAATVTHTDTDIEGLKARFSEHYPRIHLLASLQHQSLRGDQRDDAVAESIAYTWKMYREKAMAGEDPTPLLGSMVRYAALHVRAEKRLAGSKTGDVLSRVNRGQNNYHVTALPHSDKEVVASEVRNALRHRGDGPAEEAILKADYAAFLDTLTEKERSLVESLQAGFTMSAIARQRGISHTAVQDMRRTVARKWDEQFTDEERGR